MKYKHFSVEERESIQRGLWEKRSIRDIAKDLGRSPSSVSREIQRNLPPERFRYAPRLANDRAIKKRASRGRHERLKNDRIRSYVVRHLKERWSPEQISGRIRIDLGEKISPEAIYQYVYAQIEGHGHGTAIAGSEDLRPYLRRKRTRRIPPGSRRCQRVCKPHGPSIEMRPPIVDRRTRVGDWESDTVASKDNAPGLNTLVERKTGLLCVTKLHERTSAETSKAIIQRLNMLPERAKRTMTFDNGPENQDWKSIETALNLLCFFAHPYHSWERGTNENTNGLIRDYFPKKTDFRMISEYEIAFVERSLNDRPRKRLGYQTPNEVFSVALAG